MTGAKPFTKTVWSAVLMGLAAWAYDIPFTEGSSHDRRAKPAWERLMRSPAGLPARVKAIVFPGGDMLDPTIGRTWERWTVNFGSQRPVVKLLIHPGGGRILRVENLRCENPVVGTRECYMHLYSLDTYDSCDVTILGEGEVRFGVSCPRDLLLE